MVSSFRNALQGLMRGFKKAVPVTCTHTGLWLSTQGWGLHSVFLPWCPGTSLAFTLTLSECPCYARMGDAGVSNDWCVSSSLLGGVSTKYPQAKRMSLNLATWPPGAPHLRWFFSFLWKYYQQKQNQTNKHYQLNDVKENDEYYVSSQQVQLCNTFPYLNQLMKEKHVLSQDGWVLLDWLLGKSFTLTTLNKSKVHY